MRYDREELTDLIAKQDLFEILWVFRDVLLNKKRTHIWSEEAVDRHSSATDEAKAIVILKILD